MVAGQTWRSLRTLKNTPLLGAVVTTDAGGQLSYGAGRLSEVGSIIPRMVAAISQVAGVTFDILHDNSYQGQLFI